MIRKRGTDEELENVCPVCGETPKGVARCLSVDSFCKNGHNWHLEPRRRYAFIDGEETTVELWHEWVLD